MARQLLSEDAPQGRPYSITRSQKFESCFNPAADVGLRPKPSYDRSRFWMPLKGEKGQPHSRDLRQIGEELVRGKKWAELFTGVAAVEITTSGSGPTLSLRLSKKEGVPIQLVPEGTPEASVVA